MAGKQWEPSRNIRCLGHPMARSVLDQRAREHNIRFIAKIGTFGECDFRKLENDLQYVASIYEVYEILDILEAS